MMDSKQRAGTPPEQYASFAVLKVCEDCGDCWTYKKRETKCILCGGHLRIADQS